MAKVTHENFDRRDEYYVRVFTCPKCQKGELFSWFNFCPRCGEKAEFEIDEEKMDKLEEAYYN